MATLTGNETRRFSGMAGSVVGLVAGVGLAVLVGSGVFGSTSSQPNDVAPEVVAAQHEISTLTAEVDALEAFNELYRATMSRLTANSSTSALPPPELDEVYDTVFARMQAPTLSLEEINALIDAS